MDSKKLEHLKMIQDIIARMSGNIFLLKGWAITLIAAIFTIVAKNISGAYIFFSFCILFIFWILDGYFLSLERCYRSLYDEIREKKEEDIDFSMDFTAHKKLWKNSWLRSMFSKTLNIFYGALLVVMIIVSFMSLINTVKFNFGIDWKNSSNANPVADVITPDQNKK